MKARELMADSHQVISHIVGGHVVDGDGVHGVDRCNQSQLGKSRQSVADILSAEVEEIIVVSQSLIAEVVCVMKRDPQITDPSTGLSTQLVQSS